MVQNINISGSRARIFWMAAVLLMATLLAAPMLNADLLFVDEYWSLRNAGGEPFGPLDAAGIWDRTANLDPGGMGVLYHWLLALWYSFVGATPFSLRAFSLLLGLLAIAWTYRLGADFFSRRVGFFAAVIMASSAFFIDYMHEARAYTLVALLSILLIWLYQKLAFPGIGRALRADLGLGLAFVLVLTALAYTHYVALAMGAVVGLLHLLFALRMGFPRARRWWLLLLAMLCAGLLFLPWLGVTLEVVQRGSGDGNRINQSMDSILTIETLLHAFSNANIALLLLLGFFALGWRTRQALSLWIWAGLALLLVLIINALIPFMVHLRYLMLIWPALALITALGMERLSRRGLPVAALLSVWVLLGVYHSLTPNFIADMFGQIYRAPYAGISAGLDRLEELGEDGDAVLFHIVQPGFEPFNYFVLGYLMDHRPFTYDQIERMNQSFAGSDNEYLQDVAAVLGDTRFVWTLILPELPTTQRSNVVDYVLRSQYAECQTLLDQPDMLMTRYARALEPGPDAPQYDAGRLQLIRLAEPKQAGDQLDIVLGWAAEADFPIGTYSVSLIVEDEAGQIVLQQDQALPDQRPFACMGAQLDIAGLPAGDYALYAIVYAWQTGESMPSDRDDGSGRTQIGQISLAQPSNDG